MQKRGRERLPAWVLGVVWVVAGLLLLVGASSPWWVPRSPAPVTLKLGELKQILKEPGAVFQNIKIVGRSEIRGELLPRDHWTDGQQTGETAPGVAWRAATAEFDPELLQLLDRAVGPAYEIDEADAQMKGWAQQLPILVLLALSVVTGLVVFRWASGSNSPLAFGRSRHRLYAEKDLHITFEHVAGIEEAVAELREVVDFLKRPEKYQAVGGRIPKGVLLVGPPGTGKTLLARAVAGEAGVAFFSLSGSDFVEMFVGVGAARVRSLFSQAEAQAPCIIFIDELDALGKSRAGNTPGGGGHDEREQTLNQLLVEMDGFDTNRGVILMAATNRPEVLDAALLRPGRFDRTVVVDRPDIAGREAILKVHTRNVRVGANVDLRHVARLTPGSVGADLANLVNEAALMAARKGKEVAHMAEFDEAVERLAVGLERKSRLMHESEKQRIAYHEAGHALVACALPHADPVHKVSIIPRGVGALGYVLSRPEDDRHLMTQSQLENHIKIALGGTVAEELTFAEISNGATSDLQKASNIARKMVTEFGMSRLGRVYYSATDASAFLTGGPQAALRREYSEQTARAIDAEVRKILQTSTAEVRKILEDRRAALEAVARLLIDKEVIDGNELHQCIGAHAPTHRPHMPVSLVTNGKHNGTNGDAHVNGNGH